MTEQSLLDRRAPLRLRLPRSLFALAVFKRLPDAGWLDPITDTELAARLEQFEKGWGLIESIQGRTGPYTTAADYERNHLTYSLTREGEAALAGIEAAWEALPRRCGIQTVSAEVRNRSGRDRSC